MFKQDKMSKCNFFYQIVFPKFGEKWKTEATGLWNYVPISNLALMHPREKILLSNCFQRL